MKKIILAYIVLLSGITTNAQTGHYAEVNGTKIYYEMYGEGEPLLLLHGFTVSHIVWDDLVKDLSKNYKLIIPDLRGHGNSTNPSKIYTNKLSAKDMFGLMDYLNIDRFHAMGQSNGAIVLTYMATMDTSRISSLILAGAASFFPEQTVAPLKEMHYETIDSTWKSIMESYHPRGEEQIKMLLTQLRSLANDPEAINFTPPYLATIKCPTLIIHGDRDPYFSVDIPLISYKAIPNSYLWIVPNDGHFPAGVGLKGSNSIWTEVLLKVVVDFFGGKWK